MSKNNLLENSLNRKKSKEHTQKMKPGGMESWIFANFIPNFMIAKSFISLR